MIDILLKSVQQYVRAQGSKGNSKHEALCDIDDYIQQLLDADKEKLKEVFENGSRASFTCDFDNQ